MSPDPLEASTFPSDSSQKPKMRRMKLCFTMTDCTRSTDTPWNLCWRRPRSTSMRSPRRRALKPPKEMQVPSADIAHTNRDNAMNPTAMRAMMLLPKSARPASASASATAPPASPAICETKSATCENTPMMPTTTRISVVLFESPVRMSSPLVMPYWKEMRPVSTSRPANTPRTSSHTSAGASSTLPKLLGASASRKGAPTAADLRANRSARSVSASALRKNGTDTALFDAPPAVSICTVHTPNTRWRSEAVWSTDWMRR